MERSNGAVKTAFDMQVNGKHGPGRPKMTWKQLTEKDCREWKLSAIDPHDRDNWRSGVRSAMQASCLEGGPLLWIWPLYLHVNQKSDDDVYNVLNAFIALNGQSFQDTFLLKKYSCVKCCVRATTDLPVHSWKSFSNLSVNNMSLYRCSQNDPFSHVWEIFHNSW